VVILLLLALLGAPGPLAAHPLHTTLTTIGWRPKTGTLQVAVRMFTQDLSAALARRGLSAGAARDSYACGYVHAALTLRVTAGAPLAVSSCTIERSVDVTWIRLEAAATDPAGLLVLSAFLFEVFDDQINIVQASLRGRVETLLFTRGDGLKRIPP